MFDAPDRLVWALSITTLEYDKSATKLIEKYGRNGNLMKWKEQLNGDCLRRDAHSMQERCDLICPDLPKVL